MTEKSGYRLSEKDSQYPMSIGLGDIIDFISNPKSLFVFNSESDFYKRKKA